MAGASAAIGVKGTAAVDVCVSGVVVSVFAIK
jgi:hypothetical protein